MIDQSTFAKDSGDFNPMHLDWLLARRTSAGEPVVHGVGVLCWVLNSFFEQNPNPPFHGVFVRFERFVALDKVVTARSSRTSSTTRIEVCADSIRLLSIVLRHTSVPFDPLEIEISETLQNDDATTTTPKQLTFEEAACAQGGFRFETCSSSYIYLEKKIGLDGVGALLSLSKLVGMEVPGLHSIFSTIDLNFQVSALSANTTCYRVVRAHPHFRLLNIDVLTQTFSGQVQAFLRPPPVVQPDFNYFKKRVSDSNEFEGVSALVVGGSRGLGEATAKTLAASGAQVAITYNVGQTEADAVASQINEGGGSCRVFQLDSTLPVAPQLLNEGFVPNQLYYFATTKIFNQGNKVYSLDLLNRFMKVYVHGFHELCLYYSNLGGEEVLAFYPSSTALVDRPKGMTEYVMAKSAAEVLCSEIDRSMPRVRTLVRRLPRILTDQTATVTPVESIGAEQSVSGFVHEMNKKMLRS
jgi:short chain dehydrogenase/MaoC like domain